MRNDVSGIDLSFFDPFEKRLHVVMHVGLAHLHGDAFTERSSERNFIEQASVNAGDRDCAALAHTLNRLAKNCWTVCLEQQSILYSVIDALQFSWNGLQGPQRRCNYRGRFRQ